jgi:hypothetical protein
LRSAISRLSHIFEHGDWLPAHRQRACIHGDGLDAAVPGEQQRAILEHMRIGAALYEHAPLAAGQRLRRDLRVAPIAGRFRS